MTNQQKDHLISWCKEGTATAYYMAENVGCSVATARKYIRIFRKSKPPVTKRRATVKR